MVPGTLPAYRKKTSRLEVLHLLPGLRVLTYRYSRTTVLLYQVRYVLRTYSGHFTFLFLRARALQRSSLLIFYGRYGRYQVAYARTHKDLNQGTAADLNANMKNLQAVGSTFYSYVGPTCKNRTPSVGKERPHFMQHCARRGGRERDMKPEYLGDLERLTSMVELDDD
jgi:hypothetical protein